MPTRVRGYTRLVYTGVVYGGTTYRSYLKSPGITGVLSD